MQRDPEIVKILREEERHKTLQAQSNTSTESLQKPEDETVHDTNHSTVLCTSPPDTSESGLTEQIQILCRTAFEMCPYAILVLDIQQRILSCNTHTESLVKKTHQELYLQSISMLHSSEEWEKIKQTFDVQTDLGNQIKTKILLQQNETIDVIVQSCILKNIDGKTLGYLYIIKKISEQKQPEPPFDSLLRHTDDLIYLLDTSCQYLMVNDQVVTQLGRSRQEILGKTFSDFHSYEETKDMTQKLTWVLENGIPCKSVYCSEGRWYVRTINPIKDSFTTQTTAVLVISTEITETKPTLQNLSNGEKKYKTLFDFSPQTTLLVDHEGTILEVNERITEWIGYTPDEILEKNFFDIPWFTKESKKALKKIFSKRYTDKKIPPFQIEAHTKHGEKRTAIVYASSVGTHQGDQSNYLVTISDFPRQKQRNDVMRMKDKSLRSPTRIPNDSEKRLQVVLENSLDMIYQFDLQKETCEYVSPSSVKIIGYSPDEMHSFPLKNIEGMIHPEDVVRWNHHVKMSANNQQKQNSIQSIEYRFHHKTRGYRWMRDTCAALFDEHNEPLSIIGTIEDITDRKKVWEELVKSEEKYRILAETSADGVFTTDPLGRLTYVNPSFEKLCGRRKSQILATPFRNYLLEDSVYFFQQIFIDVRKKNDKIENVELELVAGDGCIIPIEANIAPLTKQEEFGGVVCTVRDITQRREIEDELKKNERLKTEFMNIAAHELRSPVTPIKGYLDLIIHDNESNQKIKNWAKISLRNAERLLKLVNDILDVSRLDSDTMRFDMEKIDLVELLNEIAEDMRPAIVNKKLEFRVNIPSPLPHIIGDKNRLSQVLKNLIGNSLKFTDCGFIGLEADKKDNHILITVEDTGIGISKDEIRKIFTKFYQAYTGEDRNNEGTGLGLFISKEIVKKHNGEIWAESEIGKGSRFIIQLPYVYKMIIDFKT